MYNHADNDTFPMKTGTMEGKTKFKQPWMTAGLLNSCRNKHSISEILENPNLQNKKIIEYKNKFITIRINAEKLLLRLNFKNITMI